MGLAQLSPTNILNFVVQPLFCGKNPSSKFSYVENKTLQKLQLQVKLLTEAGIPDINRVFIHLHERF